MLDVNTLNVDKRIAAVEEQIEILKKIHEGRCTCSSSSSSDQDQAVSAGAAAKRRWQERYHKHGSKSIIWSSSNCKTEGGFEERRSTGRRRGSGRGRDKDAYWKLLAVFIGYVLASARNAVA